MNAKKYIIGATGMLIKVIVVNVNITRRCRLVDYTGIKIITQTIVKAEGKGLCSRSRLTQMDVIKIV